MTFEDVLSIFKENETPEDVLPLLNNHAMQKIAIAWPKIKIKRIKTSSTAPPTQNEQWAWLWSQVEYDVNELMAIVNIYAGIERHMACLIGNRIIYPDGTISSYATKALRQIMMAQLKAKPKKEG